MSDYTIDDLVAAAEGEPDGGPDEPVEQDDGGTPGGEWVLDLYDRLDSSGRLDRILFGDEPREMDEIRAEQAESPAVPAPEDHEGSGASPQRNAATDGSGAHRATGSNPTGGSDLDADQLKNVMLEIYDNSEMIPGVSEDPQLSELIKLVDSKPDLVNRLLKQYL